MSARPRNPHKARRKTQSAKRRDRFLEKAIQERRVLFFGGLPKYVLPSRIKTFFEDEFGWVDKVLTDSKRVKNKAGEHHQLHRGSGFIVMRYPGSIAHLEFSQHFDFDGHAIKVRVALTSEEARKQGQDIKLRRRKVHLTGFPRTVSVAQISASVKILGTVEEISYIPTDTHGKTSCFIVFSEEYMADKLTGQTIELGRGHKGIFGPAYSPYELQKIGSGTTPLTASERSQASETSSSELEAMLFRFNIEPEQGRYRGIRRLPGLFLIVPSTRDSGFQMLKKWPSRFKRSRNPAF
jgi:hypothetical protein